MIDPVERNLFLEGLYLKYNYDFRRYTSRAMERRLDACLRRFGEVSLLALLERILRSPDLFAELLPMLTIGTTDFFREPGCFAALKDEVVARWPDHIRPRIWVAGCSTGEEVISLAVLLHEAGWLTRSRIFASDINPRSLKQAARGVYHLTDARRFTSGYHSAGGEGFPSDYFSVGDGSIRFRADLLSGVEFVEHNLAGGDAFTDMDVILCRNVLIYFEKDLQERVLKLFRSSLRPGGFLALGRRESLLLSGVHSDFEKIEGAESLYRLKG